MFAFAMPTPHTGLPHTQLRPWHATLLVLAVLLAHVWLLAGSPRWLLSPQASSGQATAVPTPSMITRQIAPPASVAPATVAPARATPLTAPSPSATSAPTSASSEHTGPAHATAEHSTQPPRFASARELEDLDHSLSAPVALPARSAAAVDLPPYKRPNPDAANAHLLTAFKAPPSALLKYTVNGEVRHIGYTAWAELLWRQDGQRYDARLEVGMFLLGSRVQTSSGLLGVDGLMPLRFGDKTRSEQAAHFQRDKGVISFSANTPDVPLLKGAQDRLSIVLQLSALLAADPTRYPPGTMLSFQTASQREAEIWQFTVEKEDLLALPYGAVSAIKLNRNPRREFDQRIELWLAPDMDYVPVRLRITNANGDFVDQLLRNIEKPGS